MITHDPFIFTRLLSKRIVSCELPLLAILCWLTFALTHHTDFDPDKVAQVAGAVNFLDGRGLVVFNIDEHPTPHLQAHPIIGWPPLFSLVYAGLYALIGNHWYTSQTLDLCFAALLLLAWHAILRTLVREGALSNAAVAVVWVVWILVKGPAESEHPGVYTRVDLSGSDLMALAFFSVTIWCLISAARGESSVVAGIISGLALAAACFTRYAYYPLAVLLPFSYGALAWIRPIFRRQLLIAFALSAFLALLGVAATVGYEYLAAGRALVPNPLNHIQRGTPSWYWHHLGRMSPFPASALGFTSFADWLARKCPAWASILPSFAAWLVSLAILIVLCYGLRVGCMQRCSELMSAFDKRPATCVFILAGLATCLIVVGMVSYLSVHNPPELWFPGGWTYVMGSRYYAPLHPFIIVWVVLSIHSSSALCRVKGMATLERSDEKGVRPPKQEPCLLSFRTLLLSLVICCMALLASFTLRNWKVVKWITDYGYTRTGYNWLYRDLESVEVAVRSLRRNKAFVFLAMVDSKGPTRDPSEAEEAQAIFDNIADVLGWKVRLTGVVLTPARTLASLPYERIQGGCVLLVLGPERQYPFTDLPDVLRERKDVKPIARLTRGRVLYEWSAMPVRSD